MRTLRGVLASLRSPTVEALRDALAVVLPTECAGCGAPDRAVCRQCAEAMQSSGSGVESLVVTGERAPPLLVWSALPYEGAVTRVLSGLKESGRTDVATALARPLSGAVAQARRRIEAKLPPGRVLELTFAPSSAAAYRKRGYNPVRLLLTRAQGRRSAIVSTLRVVRSIADQAGLGAGARQANISGSLGVRRRYSARSALLRAVHRRHPRCSLAGRHFLLVDDVITTGSTLLECRRVLECHGAHVWGAASLAFTESRSGFTAVHHVRDESEADRRPPAKSHGAGG